MIEVHDISVRYASGAQALQSTSLLLKRGDFTVLLGSSGAGKSTLLRSLNGMVPVTTGHVSASDLGRLDGSKVLREHRRRTGMVFQQHQLIGRASVLDNVLMGRLGFHGTWRTLLPFGRSEQEQALRVIERVGLIEYALQRADQLSGGQQQRVGIARALVQEPRLVLADEPVASLDPATADQVLSDLRTIAKQDGLTAIVSLHQLDFARRYADRIIALSKGVVVYDGLPSGLGDTEIRLIYGSTPSSSEKLMPDAVPALSSTMQLETTP